MRSCGAVKASMSQIGLDIGARGAPALVELRGLPRTETSKANAKGNKHKITKDEVKLL